MDSILILKRQGYKLLQGATIEPATIWQGPDGRRVLLEEGRIYTKADIEQRARHTRCTPIIEYYGAVVRNWE